VLVRGCEIYFFKFVVLHCRQEQKVPERVIAPPQDMFRKRVGGENSLSIVRYEGARLTKIRRYLRMFERQ